MKRIALTIISLLLLSGCSSATEEMAPQKFSVPKDCVDTKILAAFPDKVPNAKYVPTKWEPSEGTDLYAVYEAGGIACTYGIQEAEVGATVMWAPNDNNAFGSRESIWIADGQKAIDLPGLAEEKAYYLSQGNESGEEYIVWGVNLLINGTWIQVNATFFQSIEEAMPLIEAAVNSLVALDVSDN